MGGNQGMDSDGTRTQIGKGMERGLAGLAAPTGQPSSWARLRKEQPSAGVCSHHPQDPPRLSSWTHHKGVDPFMMES